MRSKFTKKYENHYGVDLKSSDLNRPEQFASYLLNSQHTAAGSPQKRKGFQAHAATSGGYGMWTYERRNPITGADEKEVLKIDQTLYKMASATLSIAYSGSATTCQVSVYLDPTLLTYQIMIVEGATTVLSTDLGIGFDEASPVTIATIATAINAIANFTATTAGTTTTPAAFLSIIRNYDIVQDGTLTLTAKSFSSVNTPIANPLSTYYSKRNNDDFENVSAVQIQNCMYFGSGWDYTMKYDGQNFYRAGIPEPISLTVALAGGGSVTGNNYLHVIRYIQYDNSGNIIEGNLFFSTSGVLNAAGQNFTLTIPNILAASGFNTNCALVNGNQVGITTITVTNSPHTMKVGDIAYFLDGVSGLYVERAVTAVTATTITIAGANVNVLNGAVISNNLRIGVYRNETAGSSPLAWQLVAEIPNNSFSATQTYTDSKTDAQLGEDLIEPATDRSPPPKGKYLANWNSIMVIGGKVDEPINLYYSDVENCEYFPADSNQLIIESGAQDTISGIAPNNEVFVVGGQRSFTVISGDVLTGQLRIETKSRDIGVSSHASMQELDGWLMWLSDKGPRYSTGGQIPLPLGPSPANDATSRIDPEFDNSGRISTEVYKLKRAVGFIDRVNQLYQVYVPAETSHSGTLAPNDNSKVYIYEKNRDAWLVWNNLNYAGGVCIFGTESYFSERRYSDFTSSVQSILYRRHNLEDAWDYADNNTFVDWDYSMGWEAFGEPNVLKTFLAVKTFFLEEIPNNTFTLTIKQEVNYESGAARATFDIIGSEGGYGITPYGTTPYGDPGNPPGTHSLARDRIKSMRLRFQNQNIHENVALTGWEIEAVRPYRAGFKP